MPTSTRLMPPASPSFLEIRSRIVERYPALSPQLQAISQFALANPETMAVEPTAKLAKRLSVQPSSLVRFAKALGYDGLSEMKRGFRAHLIFKSAAARDRDAQLGQCLDGVAGTFTSLVRSTNRDLENLSETLDMGSVEEAVRVIQSARQIYISAQHVAYPCACWFAWCLLQQGRACHLLDNVGGFALPQSQLAHTDDLLVAISLAPYQPSVVEAAKLHVTRGGKVLGVTDTQLSPLVPHTSVLIEIPSHEGFAARSMAGVSIVLQTLALAVGKPSAKDIV